MMHLSTFSESIFGVLWHYATCRKSTICIRNKFSRMQTWHVIYWRNDFPTCINILSINQNKAPYFCRLHVFNTLYLVNTHFILQDQYNFTIRIMWKQDIIALFGSDSSAAALKREQERLHIFTKWKRSMKFYPALYYCSTNSEYWQVEWRGKRNIDYWTKHCACWWKCGFRFENACYYVTGVPCNI